MDNEEMLECFISAFNDKNFQESLDEYNKSITEKIKKFANSVFSKEPYKYIFSIESRVKSEASFKEKIQRKNYLRKWSSEGDAKDLQKTIRMNLPDLIGIRINCAFGCQEDEIYNCFKKMHSNSPELKSFVFNFNENTRQKNSHIIYKFTGKFMDEKGEYVNFEVQIKSVMHNIWGEVEHRFVYKNKDYNGLIDQNQHITEAMYSILEASDQQLFSLFNSHETTEKLINSIFYNYTKAEISSRCGTDILANHYAHYFNLYQYFASKDIKEFVICKLSNKEYNTRDIDIDEDSDIIETLNILLEKVKESFPEFYLKSVYEIDAVLHKYKNGYEDFLRYMLTKVLKIKDNSEELGFEDNCEEDMEDANAGKAENNSNKYDDYLTKIDELMGGCRIND